MKIKECEGAVIDATIIESASRPKTVIEAVSEDRKEEEQKDKEIEISYAKDTDARWLKKGKKCYFGYKGFIATDTKDGYIEKVHLTPANKSEVRQLEESLPDKKAKRIYVDKGYASKENREKLKSLKIREGIMSKAYRGKRLSYWEKIRNKLISKKRFIVEQAFGTLKRRFNFTRAWYLTKEKVAAQFICKAICYNLLKAINKVAWV
ncbi:MAG: IS5 family transposase [Candidatus Omnitrophica bacterium]|nr:IS5 family transposase [Candidatus Omnitrophota bacterium]